MQSQREDHLPRSREGVPSFIKFSLHELVVRTPGDFPGRRDANGKKVCTLGSKAVRNLKPKSRVSTFMAPDFFAVQPHVRKVVHAIEDQPGLLPGTDPGCRKRSKVPPLLLVDVGDFGPLPIRITDS